MGGQFLLRIDDLDSGRVRGALLWNTWGQVDAARALIAANGPFDAQNVRGRLPAA